MVLLGKIMILQGVGHPISCLGVCYANDPKKGGYMTPAPALDLTTSLPGDFVAKLTGEVFPADLSPDEVFPSAVRIGVRSRRVGRQRADTRSTA